MADEKFDCIVVGGGLAGLTAAYILAKEGTEVLLIEKGNYCGSKNVTGGRLYVHSLEKVIPGFADNAPIERKIVKERLSYEKDGEPVTVEYDADTLTAQEGDSYSVLRGKFDQWLAEQAEEQGAMIVCGVKVDDLLQKDGKVCGVVAGEEEMEADAVILADGVNSLLSAKLGFKERVNEGQAAVGVKEIIGLPEETINERFGVKSGEGVAWIFLDVAEGFDGFLYTNKDSISVGITMRVGEIRDTSLSVPEMLEEFKRNSEIEALITGGTLLEYLAHLIPEGSADMVPKLIGDGVLIAGDAAALCANLGFTISGMDLAIESGKLAAETLLKARESGDFSEQSLSRYKDAIYNSYILKRMKQGQECMSAIETGSYKNDSVETFNSIISK